jgi:hypothetical protein
MTTAAEYREYAEECLQALRAAVVPEVREALVVMAQRWLDLAEQTERAAQAAPPPADRPQDPAKH